MNTTKKTRIAIQPDVIHRQGRILEEQELLLAFHLREIAANETYQRHKGILKARRREIATLHQLLNEIDHEFALALGEDEQG